MQLPLKYFLDTSLNSGRGKGFFFFFFFKKFIFRFDWVNIDLVNAAWRPNKVRWAARPPQRPINAPSYSFLTSFLTFL